MAVKIDLTDAFEPGGAEVLADSAVRRMFEYVADGHVDAEGDVTLQLISSIFTTVGLIPNFSKQSVETKLDYDAKQVTEEEAKEKPKYQSMKWTDEGVFSRTGIVTPDGRKFKGINSTEQIKRKLQGASDYMSGSVAWAKTGTEQALKNLASMSGTQLKKLTENKDEILLVDAPEEQLPSVEVAQPSPVQPLNSIGGFFTSAYSSFNNTVNGAVSMVADKLTSVGEVPIVMAQDTSVPSPDDDEEQIIDNSSTNQTSAIPLSRCDQIDKYGYRLGTLQEVFEYGLDEVPQTEEEKLVTQHLYYPSAVYDYLNDVFVAKEEQVNVQDLNHQVKLLTSTLVEMKSLIEKQQQEIVELRSKLNV